MKSNILVSLTKRLLDFMFYVGIAVCLGVPFIFWQAGKYYRIFKSYYIPFCIIFMISGVFALLIVWELSHMFRTIVNQNPFVRQNVISLKRMGICAFIIAVLMASRLLFIVTPAALVLVVVFSIAGLFSIVLSQVFDQAVTYKQENDLTI